SLLGPWVHGEARREPGQRVPNRGVVVARDDDDVLDARQEAFDHPTHDRLALELEEQLLASHTAGESGGENDTRDHARRREARRRRRRARGAFDREGGETRSRPAACGRNAPGWSPSAPEPA